MPFVPETGVGLSNSNSFITVAYFKDYHGIRGNSLKDSAGVDFTDEVIQQALVKTSDYLEAKFTYIGIREVTSQAMEWPRVDAYYRDGRIVQGVPVEMQECTAELALKVLNGTELAPDPSMTSETCPSLVCGSTSDRSSRRPSTETVATPSCSVHTPSQRRG